MTPTSLLPRVLIAPKSQIAYTILGKRSESSKLPTSHPDFPERSSPPAGACPLITRVSLGLVLGVSHDASHNAPK